MEKKNTTPIYDVNYFISKFEKIPENKWCILKRISDDGTQRCAHGHCYSGNPDYANQSQEEKSLSIISMKYLGLHGFGLINNGTNPAYQQPTPKQRILAALYDIRGISKRNDITSELAKDSIPETLDVKISLPQSTTHKINVNL